MDRPGTVTLSIDLELAWGMTDMPEQAAAIISDRRRAETRYLERLLDRCERGRLPITFAVVGHLLLEACDGVHPDVPSTAPLEADPGTDGDRDPTFFAPDLVDRIRRTETAHEIGTHTFSHVLCDSVEPAVVQDELAAVESIHAERGLDGPRSLVVPRNLVPDLDLLGETGIEVVRTARPEASEATRARAETRLRHWLSATSPMAGEPRQVDGVTTTPARPYPTLTAVHLPAGRAKPPVPFRAVPHSLCQRRHLRYLERGLEQAAREGAHLHLWTHLYNLANESQWPPIASFLETLAAYRDEGRVRVETMGSVAERVTTDGLSEPPPT